MSKYVTFEIAKLLKEKGFYIETLHYFKLNSDSREPEWNGEMLNWNSKLYADLEKLAAPIISDVIDWLLEKHGIWISVSMENNEEDKISFYYFITENLEEDTYFRKRFSNFNSPKEAYLAAIEYTLKNLI